MAAFDFHNQVAYHGQEPLICIGFDATAKHQTMLIHFDACPACRKERAERRMAALAAEAANAATPQPTFIVLHQNANDADNWRAIRQ